MGCDTTKMVKTTRATIKTAIVENCAISASKATRITDSIIEEICKALIKEKTAKFSGFGSFFVKKRAARKGRNMQTGESVFIPSQYNVIFRPSQTLKYRLQKTNIKG